MVYKITVFDENCASCTSGVKELFTDNIEEFEKEYFSKRPEKKENYLRSKQGELVVDYYSDDPDLNMYQSDSDASLYPIITMWMFEDKTFTIENAYGWDSKIYAKRTEIDFTYTYFKESLYLLARYRMRGVCSLELISDRESDSMYRQIVTFGNPIFRTELHSEKIQNDPVTGKKQFLCSKEYFAEDKLETFCWIPIYLEDEIDIREPIEDERLFNQLMADIVGEAG